MDTIFRTVSHNAWLLFIVVTCANAATWWNRGKTQIKEHPELEGSYRTLVRGLLIYGNLPWLVMGAGIVTGRVPTVFHYFNPRNGPFVIAFYVTTVGLWVAMIRWVFFRNGIEQIIRHPGLLNFPIQEPWKVKALLVLMLASGVAALAMMILGNFQFPE